MKYYVLILLVSLMSCKNNSRKDSIKEGTKEIMKIKEEILTADDILKVHLYLKVQKDDIFEVYYTSDSVEEKFSAKRKIRKKIRGVFQKQNIVFELPINVLPYKFRIDFGQNKEQLPIEIDNIKLELNGEFIYIEQSLLESFFAFNQFIEYDSGRINIIEVNGKRDPFIISKALLIKKMQIEL